jgi:hypothetical protein
VGDGQAAADEAPVSVKEHVEVEGAGAVPRLPVSSPAGGDFGFPEKGEKGRGGESSQPDDDGIQEIGLGREGRDRRRFIEG